MRTFAEIDQSAIDEWPFSNGTEAMQWQANWCDRCVHDKPMRDTDGKRDPDSGILGCPIYAVALLPKTPTEWISNDPAGLGDQWRCVEFRNENDGPGPEPQPVPDPPGMDALLPREDYTAPLMFTANAVRHAEVLA